MLDEETVPPPVESVEAVEEDQEVIAEAPVEEEKIQETQVPLYALQKERQKRKDAEMELKWIKEQQHKKTEVPVESDEARYESATKEDLNKSQHEVIRQVEERAWIRNNPEKYERVVEQLPEFLKRRPNLAIAIQNAPNKFEEAWELMTALTPKEQKQISKPQPKKDAPGSPSAVPKGAAMNHAVDVMNMNDAEFNAWRRAQKRPRSG